MFEATRRSHSASFSGVAGPVGRRLVAEDEDRRIRVDGREVTAQPLELRRTDAVDLRGSDELMQVEDDAVGSLHVERVVGRAEVLFVHGLVHGRIAHLVMVSHRLVDRRREPRHKPGVHRCEPRLDLVKLRSLRVGDDVAGQDHEVGRERVDFGDESVERGGGGNAISRSANAREKASASGA